MAYSIGLDYGTKSVRCLIINVANGNELVKSVYEYETGNAGILLDGSDHNLARQNPTDHIQGLGITVKGAIEDARKNDSDFDSDKIIGIGVDTTGSTPLPVDEKGMPLAFKDEFKDNLNAQAWLWKDHTSYAEAEEITALAEKNPMLMQIYADVTGREMKISRSGQTCALGSAIATAVVAGTENGGYNSFADAQKAMCGIKNITYKPNTENHKVYKQIYKLYMQIHDAFGTINYKNSLHNVMKNLLDIKEKANA